MRKVIEAVTTCVDYGDYLREIAPVNRPLLDRWIVVTTPKDEETRQVCARHSIECILSEEFYRDGATFAKGRAINMGLRQMTGEGWLLHMDGDIALPLDLHQCLEDAHLIPGNIYGCNRLCVPGEKCWDQLRERGLYSRYNGWLAEYRDRPAGCYVGGVPAGIGPGGSGYTPIGFFQLWHGQETLRFGHTPKWYPAVHGGAARSDTAFASLWDRQHRIMIPELLVFHVEAENAKDGMGHNWNGRKTPRFRGNKPASHHHKHPYT